VDLVNEPETPTSSRKRLTTIFIFLFLMNLIRVFDNGIIPAIATTLKEREGLTDVQVGTLGSLVYIGEVVGSLLAVPAY